MSTVIKSIFDSPKPKSVHFLNSYNMGLAMIDRQYAQLLGKSTHNIVDGRVFMRTLKVCEWKRGISHIRGVDFFRESLKTTSSSGLKAKKHFLLGSTDKVLENIQKFVLAHHPEIHVGSYSPPFTDYESLDFREIAIRLLAFNPDVVWVGLGTPKQDYIVEKIRNECGITAIAIGAAFDFVAGNKTESKMFYQVLGLEWMHRLFNEPKRLWRRYFIISPISFFYPIRIKVILMKR